MSTRLVVDNQNELQEVRKPNPPQHPAVKVVATILSYLFHPVFVPIYVMLFLVYVHPYLFVDFNAWEKLKALLQTIMMYAFFPLVTALLLKGLGFINSIFLKDQRERIIPLVVCGIWYFWIWYVWRNINEPFYPREAIVFAMATFLAGSVALMMNIYMKVSLHAVSMGVLLALMLWMGLTNELSSGLYSSITLLIVGAVCTARFIVSDHTPKEVYGGLIAGMLSVPVACFFS
jgi:hypothetical protein